MITLYMILISLALYALKRASTKAPPKIHLPGPRGLPILGSFLSLKPTKPLHHVLGQWQRQYGDIFTFRYGCRNFVVLNTPEAANNVLVDQAHETSCRPQGFLYDHMRMDLWGISFWDVGPKWKEYRARINSIVQPKAVAGFDKGISEAVNLFMDEIRKKDKAFDIGELSTRYGYDVSFRVAFGRPLPEGDQYINTTREFFILNSFLADLPIYFPILKYFWGGWRKRADAWFERLRSNCVTGLSTWVPNAAELDLKQRAEPVKSEYEKNGTDSLCSRLLAEQDSDLTYEQIAMFCGLVTLASSQQTGIMIRWMMAIAATHPEIQEKIRKEIPANIEFPSDIDQYPYLLSFVKEVMRMRPPASISGFPRELKGDIEYQGIKIPAGTRVMTNAWAIQHRPDDPNAEVFNPDRFKDWNQSSQVYAFKQPMNRDTVLWGWGRRMCPGIRLAEKTIVSTAAMLFSNFKVEPEDPNATFDDIKIKGAGPIVDFEPFPLKFIPRK